MRKPAEKYFFEIDETTGTAHRLAKWQGAVAPCGGPVVYAGSETMASRMYRACRYGHGCLAADDPPEPVRIVLKGDVTVDGKTWHGVIH